MKKFLFLLFCIFSFTSAIPLFAQETNAGHLAIDTKLEKYNTAKNYLKIKLFPGDKKEKLEDNYVIATSPDENEFIGVIVIDYPDGPYPLANKYLEKWGKDLESVKKAAIENTIKGNKKEKFEIVTQDDFEYSILISSENPYIASSFYNLSEIRKSTSKYGFFYSIPYSRGIFTMDVIKDTVDIDLEEFLETTNYVYSQSEDYISPSVFWFNPQTKTFHRIEIDHENKSIRIPPELIELCELNIPNMTAEENVLFYIDDVQGVDFSLMDSKYEFVSLFYQNVFWNFDLFESVNHGNLKPICKMAYESLKAGHKCLIVIKNYIDGQDLQFTFTQLGNDNRTLLIMSNYDNATQTIVPDGGDLSNSWALLYYIIDGKLVHYKNTNNVVAPAKDRLNENLKIIKSNPDPYKYIEIAGNYIELGNYKKAKKFLEDNEKKILSSSGNDADDFIELIYYIKEEAEVLQDW